MAKPRAEYPPAEAIRALADSAGRLAVRVTPGAREDALAIDGGKLMARVRAVPDSGKANLAVLALVAKALGLAPSHVQLLRGSTSREKLVSIPILQP
jgi:uncharacterized protein YggU (UPF0235/DUF167 family)